MHAVEALAGGRRVGHYEIVEKLGQGGWGAVYKARDTRLDRLVALKVLSATRLADEKHRRRFMQEARSASALNHPNIVTIYDIVSAGSEYYIAMEYIEGQTLREMAERIPDVLRAAVSYLRLRRRLGDVSGGRATLAEVVGKFTEGLDSPLVSVARKLLEQ